MLRLEKESFVSDLETIYHNSNTIIITHYHGLNVKALTELRCMLRVKSVYLKIAKNTLSKIAASRVKLPLQNLNIFSGPIAVVYSSSDPIAAAKGVVEFAKVNNNLKILCGIVNNQVLNLNSIEQLAKLPSLDHLRGEIISRLQSSTKALIRVMQTPASALVNVMKAYAEKNKII